MRTSRIVAAAVAAAALAGCAVGPRTVPGTPLPLGATPTGTASPTGGGVPPATRPAGSPTASGVAALPTGYRSYRLAGYGTTVLLDVPVGWTERVSDRTGAEPSVGRDFGDPSGTLLMKVELTPRQDGRTARQGLDAYEPTVTLTDYRRLAIVDVPGVGDSALDWTFTFTRDGRLRQVADRMIVAGDAGIAVYFSALSQDYDRTLPIWHRGIATLEISAG